MITKSDIEEPRSPKALRQFVLDVIAAVRADENERHHGMLKKALYKEFLDEIVPLSYFAVLKYPENCMVRPVLGNQGFDALVLDESGIEFDRIEMTSPGDGAKKAQDARLTVKRGYGEIRIGKPGDDFDALIPHILATCRTKAQKDYGDCTLVVAIAPMEPFQSYEARYEKQIETLRCAMVHIEFKARRVFLLVLPDRVVEVNGNTSATSR